MTIQAIDTADPRNFTAKVNQFKAQGGTTAIVYINPLGTLGDKTAKKPTIDALHAAGINVGFVCEGWGGSNNFSHHDINGVTGTQHANVCANWLTQLGAPSSVAVYFAIDNDVSHAQYSQWCQPYFVNARQALGSRYRTAAYGCGYLLTGLDGAKLIDFRWLSNAMGWNGSRAYRDAKPPMWNILQGLPTRSIGGIDVDPDQLNPNTKDFGFWLAPSNIKSDAVA